MRVECVYVDCAHECRPEWRRVRRMSWKRQKARHGAKAIWGMLRCFCMRRGVQVLAEFAVCVCLCVGNYSWFLRAAAGYRLPVAITTQHKEKHGGKEAFLCRQQMRRNAILMEKRNQTKEPPQPITNHRTSSISAEILRWWPNYVVHTYYVGWDEGIKCGIAHAFWTLSLVGWFEKMWQLGKRFGDFEKTDYMLCKRSDDFRWIHHIIIMLILYCEK